MNRIVVFGSANMDLVVEVNQLPVAGETRLGGDLRTVFGGKGANQAIAARRLGAEVEFVGAVGDDAFGHRYRGHLEDEGIGTAHLKTIADRPTGCALIFVDARGDNMIVVSPGANHALTSEDVDAASARIESADLVMVQFEIPLPVVQRVLDIASRVGTPVLMNPSPVDPAFAIQETRIQYLVVNEVEAATLSQKSPAGEPERHADHVTALLQSGVETVFLTRGGHSTVVGTREAIVEIPTFQVEVVDTVGAGDAFAGALAVALVEGKEVPESVRFANCAAALATTRLGAQSSLPFRKEVENRLANE
jgi:ribokinase